MALEIIKKHSSLLKGIVFFSVLFVVLYVASMQLQTSIINNGKSISSTKELQLDSRDIQNNYRNLSLDYLKNLTHKVDEQAIKITHLENIINNSKQ